MNPAQKLMKRAEEREDEVIATFLGTAQAVCMSPQQLAAMAVFVFADVRTKDARVIAYNLNPAPEIRTLGPRIMFMCERARLVEVWIQDEATVGTCAESAVLLAKLQMPPPPGFFWILSIAGAGRDTWFSWALSLIVFDAACEEVS